MKSNIQNNTKNSNKKPKRPIGNYIMLAIFILMVLFYLVYVNGYVAD